MITKRKNNIGKTFIFLCLATLFTIGASAQEDAQEDAQDKGWNFVISPYVYVPVANGDVMINYSGGSLYHEVTFGGLLAFEAYNPKWSIYSDLLITNIDTDIDLPVSSRTGTFEANTTFLGFYGMRRVATWFEVGLGAKIIFSNSNITADAREPLFPELDEEYNNTGVSPLIVYRFTFLDTDKWNLRMRGDVGGFGAYSIFTYMINPSGGYRISDLLEVNLAYRYLYFKKDDEDNGNKIDLNFHGPQIGVLFHF